MMKDLSAKWKALSKAGQQFYHDIEADEKKAQDDTKSKLIAIKEEHQPSSSSSHLDDHSFGAYRVIQKLGGGTFGEVFSALSKDTGRLVAVKVFRKATHMAKLEADAIIAVQLTNQTHVEQCITRLRKCAHTAPIPYLVLELGAPDLGNILKKDGKQVHRTTLNIGKQLIQGLQIIHRSGLLHLDIKPSNLLWNEQTQDLRMVDFGAAEGFPVTSPRFKEYVSLNYRPQSF